MLEKGDSITREDLVRAEEQRVLDEHLNQADDRLAAHSLLHERGDHIREDFRWRLMTPEERSKRDELGPAASPEFDEPPEEEKPPALPLKADRSLFDPDIDYIYENNAYRPVTPHEQR